uniref:Uncharacterized protein n=1 Tax=Gasterosteus aculeatus aculeatus TaxID=481459 RepID=A0AAQ4PMU7_GASAC
MASVVCRVQYLEDSDPFVCTNFPEPRRPPTVNVEENLPLGEQIAGIHKLLEAPLKLEDCTLQLSPLGNYLDLDLSLDEQRDELESFYQDVTKGKKPIMILRTQLSVRVHCILGMKPWTYLMEVLEERNGSDTELLMFTMTLINKTLSVLPDQDSFYDVTDSLEQLGLETIIHRHMSSEDTQPDLRAQFTTYETSLKHEDEEQDDSSPHLRKERRKMAAGEQEGQRNRGLSGQNLPDRLSSSAGSSPSTSPTPPAFLPTPSPAVSSPSPTGALEGSRSSSPLTSDPGSPASSPSGSHRGSPLPPRTPPNGAVTVGQESGSPTSASSSSDLPEQEKSSQLNQQPLTISSDDSNVNPDKPVLRKLEKPFLRTLAATQWEKKRRSTRLSQSRLSSSDDIIPPGLQPAEGANSVPTEGRPRPISTSSSLDTNRNSDSQKDPASAFQQQSSTLSTNEKLYSKTSSSGPQSPSAAAAASNASEEEAAFLPGGDLGGRGRVFERLSNFTTRSVEPPNESRASRRAELEGLEGSAQAALARLAEEQQVRMSLSASC